MDTLFDWLLPDVRFTGAFLTEDVRKAFIIPLVLKAGEMKKTLVAGDFFVCLINGMYYEATGKAVFDGASYRTTIEVRPATCGQRELSEMRDRLPDGFEIPKHINIPRVFLGVDKEPYALGIISHIS